MRIETNVSNLDILPTLRKYLGLKISLSDVGENLLPLLKGNKKSLTDRYIYSYLLKFSRKRDGQAALGKKSYHRSSIHKNWKSIQIDLFQLKTINEFYDLMKDPLEKDNIFRDHKKLAHQLSFKFLSFEKQCQKFFQQGKELKLDEKKKRELKTLGYIDN